ncbi:hypothetical protein EV181_001444 [Coemansia sp. RSA 532]|nr:hypothetical protein EV181_001444 [Coemansia sp. RSA 532]KAJ2200992.1 hypothetical protein IW144_000689 [Coemansia sp. RSA 522]
MALTDIAYLAYVALSVSVVSTIEYFWRGPRLPRWDLKFQLRRDIMHRIISSVVPQLTDDSSIDSLDLPKIVHDMRAKAMPAAELKPEDGVYQVIGIPVRDVRIDPREFSIDEMSDNPEEIAVIDAGTSDKLCALCEADMQGPERTISCELVVASNIFDEQHEAQLECRPMHTGEKLILYFHGGGYIIGSSAMYRQLISRISQASCARVLGVDYRLAPEHPFPAALHDAYIAYMYVLQQGFDPSRVVVAGDSAGGHLALSLTHLVQATKTSMYGGLVLLSPVTDMARDSGSRERNRNFDYLAPQPLASPLCVVRLFYAPGRRMSRDLISELSRPLVSPLRGQFTNFPRTLIQFGASEVLADDSTQLHAQMAQSKHPESFVLESYDDMLHVFHVFFDRPESTQALGSIGRFVKDV